MHIRSVISLVLMLAFVKLTAQNKIQYAAAFIPDSLKKNALAVTREEIVNLTITQPGKGRKEVRSVVTVLNEKGKEFQLFVEMYDQFRKLEDIEINTYDAAGNFMRRYKKRDLEKVVSDDGESLVSDNKMIYGEIKTDNYPFTIESNYTVRYDGLIDYEDFYPSFTNIATQHAVYTVITSNANKLRYHNYKYDLKPKIENTGNTVRYVFEVSNVPPPVVEPGAASRDIPRVKLAPTLFEMDGYPGDMSTWTGFGQWFSTLMSQSLELPEERKAFFQNLVGNETSDIRKVEILYRYLQENFRYVGIQLGIGGWKPFPAQFVDKKKYGDCKALSNYMQAMLKCVNIKSHYAIINSGNDEVPVDKSFPTNNFNHVIVCVPLAKDTVWLECTSRTAPFNKLGLSTENRNAFIITEQGGAMVETPRSAAPDNTVKTFSRLKLHEDGSGSVIANMAYTGQYKEQYNYYLFDTDEQQKKEFLFNQFGFKQPDKMKLEKTEGTGDGYPAHLEMEYEKLPEFSAGSKHFINPRIYRFWSFALPKIEKRTSDYYTVPRVKSDSSILELPEGYEIDQLPKSVKFSTSLCSYESNYSFDPAKRQIISICRIQINSHIVPASKYQETAKFFSDVITDQQQKIVAVKR